MDAGDEIRERLGLKESFDRWRYLQKLLDAETNIEDDNRLLFRVLHGYSKSSSDDISSVEQEQLQLGSPERTTERLQQVAKVLDHAQNGAIPALTRDVQNNLVLEELNLLLPDPIQEPEDFKSLWDAIIELHGREAVRVDERNGEPEWKARCLVARVLFYYDFLQREI